MHAQKESRRSGRVLLGRKFGDEDEDQEREQNLVSIADRLANRMGITGKIKQTVENQHLRTKHALAPPFAIHQFNVLSPIDRMWLGYVRAMDSLMAKYLRRLLRVDGDEDRDVETRRWSPVRQGRWLQAGEANRRFATMKSVLSRLSVTACAAAGLVLAGCGQKEEVPEAPPADEATVGAAEASQAAGTESAAPSVMEPAQSAMAEGSAELEQAAATANEQAAATVDESATSAPAVDAQAAAMKEKAMGLIAQYSPQLDQLKSGAASIKSLIDQKASMLPAGVSEKYQELNAMLPQLTELVSSLQVQTGDLASLAAKVQADFQKANSLYDEIKAMLPATSQ